LRTENFTVKVITIKLELETNVQNTFSYSISYAHVT
jgi:hypothetical protein